MNGTEKNANGEENIAKLNKMLEWLKANPATN
jgi:hypothetical protein